MATETPPEYRDMFRPPVNRTMRVLDRSFFKRRIDLSAARILDPKDIANCRSELYKSRDALRLDRYQAIRPAPDDPSQRCIVLRPQHEGDVRRPWSDKVSQLQRERIVDLIPYTVDLDYSYWTYHDIAAAILPAPEAGTPGTAEEEIPSSFAVVGHVAHLNLRERYWGYKHLVGELVLDKNPGIRTVINKIDDVGGENAYRTFKYEVLAGPDDLNVTVKEQGCTFNFDYSRVYWNARLSTEHERLVSLFEPGEAVCDVMAGIGPFAVPTGKKNVFVAANDLNPASFSALTEAIRRNKVAPYVSAFNEDGNDFIRSVTSDWLHNAHSFTLSPRTRRHNPVAVKGEVVTRPRVFGHYIMNLPASATSFLPAFIGLYSGADRSHIPLDDGNRPKMPMVHVYCFSTKSADNVPQMADICAEISRQLGVSGSPDEIRAGVRETTVHDVRDVAPKKRMFCASFRLPEEVAFRTRSQG